MIAETFSISRRFCGPSQSGNGGYVCGRLAKHVVGPACVRLKAPPPLEVELRVETSEGSVQLFHGPKLIAEARPAECDAVPPAAPSFSEAEAASRTYYGFVRHSFPRCFVCGPKRAVGDGLRLFPGEIEGRSMVAAPWIPDATLADGAGVVGTEILWAALDCPSAFSFLPVSEGKTVVLGELCVRVDAAVSPFDRCAVIGWRIGVDGRKHIAGSAVFSESGLVIAVGRATWIEVSADAFPAE
jgi:hypothetical protein